MADIHDMTARQVQGREQRLRLAAQRILHQVKLARKDGSQLPWMSRETGVDMSYEYERWRRWNVLREEMAHAGAEVVADLGPSRVEYWTSALGAEEPQPSEPLRAFRPVKPIVRQLDNVTSPRRPPPRFGGQAS
jgi:hypothetical protein